MRSILLLVWLLGLLAACGTSPRPDAARPPTTAAPEPTVPGCDGATLREAPADPARRGPWAVGARTVSIAGMTTEVWYPAPPGSDAGKPRHRYELRVHLPEAEAAKVPADDQPYQDCECTRDLPLDTERGPYPVIVFVHGTASFRHQSAAIVTHWASRGFVVIAADHPGLQLAHVLGMVCGGDPPGQSMLEDVDKLVAAVRAPAGGPLAFLAGHVAADRLAIAGHSAGAHVAAASAAKPGVRAVVSLAGARAPEATPTLAATLFVAGKRDRIIPWARVERGFADAPAPRHLVGLERGGHLSVSDLCASRNAQGQNMLEIGIEHGVCGAQLAGALFDCDPSYIDSPAGWAIVRHATSAVLEPALLCRPERPLRAIEAAFPGEVSYTDAAAAGRD